jgi:hypothetical protein
MILQPSAAVKRGMLEVGGVDLIAAAPFGVNGLCGTAAAAVVMNKPG